MVLLRGCKTMDHSAHGDVSQLVNEVLQSPNLRGAVENRIRQVQQHATPAVQQLQPELNSVRMPSHNIRQELHRLFPTTRRNERGLATPHKKRSAHSVFHKEIILLQSPITSTTLKGSKKSFAFETGFALSDVPFYTNWNEVEVLDTIRNLFQNFLEGTQFEILVPMGGRLVKPSLQSGRHIDGRALKSMFLQKTIYVRPFEMISTPYQTNNFDEKPVDDIPQLPDSLQVACQSGTNENRLDVSIDDPLFQNDIETAIKNSLEETRGGTSENEVTESNTRENACDIFEPTSFKDILDKLRETITEDNVTQFNIYRPDILKCSMRALRRVSFSPCNRVEVIFTDCDNTTEGAIDAGGPSREMFRLLFSYLHTSRFFTGSPNRKFISFKKELIDNNEYKQVGQLISMGLVHCGFGPRFFFRFFFNLLVEGFGKVNPTLDDLTDDEVKTEILRAIDAPDLQTLRNVVYEGTFIRLAGWDEIKDFNNKDLLIRDAIKFYVVDRSLPSFNHFVEGLQTLDVYHNIVKYPDLFFELFCDTKESVLTLEKFEKLFTMQLSEIGSNKRNAENRILSYWRDFLIDCAENEEDTCTLQEILCFCTAADIIPPAGFAIQPSIKFLHGNSCPYPMGNTCGLELHLPTIHDDYEKFKRNVTFGIRNGMVFGHV